MRPNGRLVTENGGGFTVYSTVFVGCSTRFDGPKVQGATHLGGRILQDGRLEEAAAVMNSRFN